MVCKCGTLDSKTAGTRCNEEIDQRVHIAGARPRIGRNALDAVDFEAVRARSNQTRRAVTRRGDRPGWLRCLRHF